MKITSEKLRQAVGICNRFIPIKPSLPVLANIKIESTKTKLVLSATNLENSIVLETPASGEPWETTIPAKLIVEFINLTEGELAELELDKEKLKVTCGDAQGVFNTIAASEFPKLPKEEGGGTVIEVDSLQTAVGNIAFAASSDPGRPVLNGILMRGKGGKTSLVATDSYRLAQYFLKEPYNFNDLIVPAKGFSEAVKIAKELGEEEVSLTNSESNNQMFISGQTFQITVRLIDGSFPAYEQIIPTTFVSELRIPKENFVLGIKQSAVFARDTGNVIKLMLGKQGDVEIFGSTKQIGEGSTIVKGIIEGEELEVAFNSRFLLDGLEKIKGEEAKLHFAGSLKPALIKGEEDKEFSYIVMPVKPQT
jgi:DNA polymerase-3 subunit beta